MLVYNSLERIGQEPFDACSIAGSQLELFIHRTDSMRRLVTTQVVGGNLAPHNFARACDFHPLGHSGMRFEFLLHGFSFCFSEVRYKDNNGTLRTPMFYRTQKEAVLVSGD